MPFVTTSDQTQIFYKDWGYGRPIMFHHGWPLSADDWDSQMLFFLHHGYRVIAHDRRGHGRSSQSSGGHDMDTYAADAAAVVDHLGLANVIHVGHSAGGGEVARYAARHSKGRVAKVVLIGAVPPLMVQTDTNPNGTPLEVFDQLRSQLAANRAQFFRETPFKFYGFNHLLTKTIDSVVDNWWRQGMMGSIHAQYEGIKVFSETDQTADLASIDVPALVMQGDDDQMVPYKNAAVLQARLIRHATQKIYADYSHGMHTINADVINADLLSFIEG